MSSMPLLDDTEDEACPSCLFGSGSKSLKSDQSDPLHPSLSLSILEVKIAFTELNEPGTSLRLA